MHSKSIRALLVACGCGILVLLAWKLQSRSSLRQSGVSVSAPWKQITCAGLSLQSPGDFQELPVDQGAMEGVLEESKAWQWASSDLELQVAQSAYKKGVELSLEGSVEGSIEGFRRTPGIRGLTHCEQPTEISGKPAIRVSIVAERNRQKIRLEGLTVLDGQTLYQVQALFRADDPQGPEYLRRVFGQTRLESAKGQ
jgi:hypothetical protein